MNSLCGFRQNGKCSLNALAERLVATDPLNVEYLSRLGSVEEVTTTGKVLAERGISFTLGQVEMPELWELSSGLESA